MCGHIVASDLPTGLAYVIPAKAVLEQMERQLDCLIELPKSSSSLISKHLSDRTDSLNVEQEMGQPYTSTTARERIKETGKGKCRNSKISRDHETNVPMTGTGDLKQAKIKIDLPDTEPASAPMEAPRCNERLTYARSASAFSNMLIQSG